MLLVALMWGVLLFSGGGTDDRRGSNTSNQ